MTIRYEPPQERWNDCSRCGLPFVGRAETGRLCGYCALKDAERAGDKARAQELIEGWKITAEDMIEFGD